MGEDGPPPVAYISVWPIVVLITAKSLFGSKSGYVEKSIRFPPTLKVYWVIGNILFIFTLSEN